jgi:hypothetical protein
MRATLRRYSRNWLVHVAIVAIAILIGIVVAFSARPTRGDRISLCGEPGSSDPRQGAR